MAAGVRVESQRSMENTLLYGGSSPSPGRQVSFIDRKTDQTRVTTSTTRASLTSSSVTTSSKKTRSLLSSNLTPHTSSLRQTKSGSSLTQHKSLSGLAVSASSSLRGHDRAALKGGSLVTHLKSSPMTSSSLRTSSSSSSSLLGSTRANLTNSNLSSSLLTSSSHSLLSSGIGTSSNARTSSLLTSLQKPKPSSPIGSHKPLSEQVKSSPKPAAAPLSTNVRTSMLNSRRSLLASVGKISPAKSLLSTTSTPTKPSLSITSSNLATSNYNFTKSFTSSKSTTGHTKKEERNFVSAPAARPVTKETKGAPVYKFQSEETAVTPKREKFLPPENDASLHAPETSVGELVQLKITLINAVATSLLCNPNFKDTSDLTRQNLMKLGEELSTRDPEFVLKVALYTRNNLNIRTTANFLLALASNVQACRPFLKKYYCASIRLPLDWIEVAELYQTFHDRSLNFGALPTALRKVMAAKFVEFDVYQLGKYNKDKSKKKKNNDKEKAKDGKGGGYGANTPPYRSDTSTTMESVLSVIAPSDVETEEEVERLSFTLKQLIRKIHISEPVEPVMCLLGKKYPEDREAFRRSHLPGLWEEERAGKRMKIATPETWETTVSLHGNKAKTWQDLIDHNKLPFMAMLRNLRNIIIADVSEKHHRWVVRKLNDERSVVNSRQFPFRFFSAYEVLAELERIADGDLPPKYKPKKGKKTPQPPTVEKDLLKRYRSALDNALKIATSYNVKPISGSTLILCNAGNTMYSPCTASRGLGKPRTTQEVGSLLGLMCKYACEQCTFVLYDHSKHVEVHLEEGTILDNMKHVSQMIEKHRLNYTIGMIPMSFLYEMIMNETSVDNIVLLTDTMKLDDAQGQDMMNFLKKYRRMVNPDLLFVSVDLSGKSSGVLGTIKPEHENDIYLAGYSDQILRFIAERGDSGQLTYVENIDRVNNLKELPKSALLPRNAISSHRQTTSLGAEKALMASTQRQQWKTVRIFISSTFRDMHGERDLLTRFVFPELRARAHSRQIQLYEVDLRWGVTEEDTRHHRALEICLNEISRCSYFLGLLGERYGWILNDQTIGNVSQFDWLKEEGVGRSITEVEMKHACLRDPSKAYRKAFFFFRDASVTATVPEKHRANFESESTEAREKIERLKSEIRTSGLEVYDGYPSTWLGVLEDKPMVGGLEEFGKRVLYNIWNAIQRDFPEDEAGLDPIAEATASHDAFVENRAVSFVGRRSLLLKAMQLVKEKEEGVMLMEGKPGSGKSAFMAAFAQSCSIHPPFEVISHFLGAAPSSTNISSVLTRLCHEMKRRFNLTRNVPEDYPELVNSFKEFLKDSQSASDGYKLILFIDGLDLLEEKYNARGMDWLPKTLPSNVVIILSAVENGEISVNLKKRDPPPTSLEVGKMNEWDKADMVRENLARHRKSLDESPFNNQMKLLLSKRDATNPLFLHLACEELRVFGIFEEVSSFLKSLPPTLPQLLQEVLARIERELGQDLVSLSLSLLCLVRSGLRECELSGLASLYFKNLKSDVQEVTLPAMTLSRLLRCLQGFLQPTEQESSDLLSLAHRDIEKAVKLRYMKGKGEKEREFHHLLAAYFKNECDPSGCREYRGQNSRAFDELPHHLMCSEQWKELEEVVCDINFVMAKCQLGLAQKLLEDYTPSLEEYPAGRGKELAKFVNRPRVEQFRSFVSRNLHVLTATPSLALQQAINEPSSSLIATAAEHVLHDNPQPLMRLLNQSSSGEAPCRLTIPVSSEVTCVAVSADGKQFAAGFKNCGVRVFNTSTGAEVQSFIGHASYITSLCFVGSHALCSGSHDTNLSLWDLKGGFRIATLTSHTRSVRGCAADAGGKVLVSVSWDTEIRVWDGRTGKHNCSLSTKGGRNCPLNCVSFHPSSDQLVAVGSWDTTVKIWDVFRRKRVKVLKGHRSSVQACSYAPSGRHIVSAALDGEVKVWSTKSGTAVGSIIGHSEPVNSVSYTPNGQFLLTASSDQLVKVWSGSFGLKVASVGQSEYGYAHCVVHNRLNQTVLVGYHDGHIRQFNSQTQSENFSVKLHDKMIVAVGNQGSFNMSASSDGTIKIWEGPASLPRLFLLEGHKAGITCAVWTRKGMASAAEDFSLLLWPHELSHYTQLWYKTKKSTKISIYPIVSLQGHTAIISDLSFSGNGLKMASVSRDQTIIVWDLLNRKESRTMRNCHQDWITTCAFSDTDPDTLITGSNDFNLKLWNVKTGQERITFKGHTSAINSVSFSQGCVVSAAFDGSVKIWTRKGVEITTLYCHKQRVNACVLDIPSISGESLSWADMMEEEDEDEDGGGEKAQKNKLADVLVFTASDDGTVGIWKPFVPSEIMGLVGHTDRVLAVGATLGNEIITSSRDKSIRIWSPRLPDSTVGGVSLKASTQSHVGEVSAIATAPPFLVTGGRDGRVIIWISGANSVDDKNQKPLELYTINSSTGAVASLELTLSKTGQATLLVGRFDGAIGKYKFSETQFPAETWSMGPTNTGMAASGVAFAEDWNCFVTVSWGCNLLAVREVSKELGQLGAHPDWLTGIAIVKGGGGGGGGGKKGIRAVAISQNRHLYVWKIEEKGKKFVICSTHQIPDEEEDDDKKKDAWLLCVCQINSKAVVIGDSGGRVYLWSLENNGVLLSKKIHRCAINGVVAIDNGKLLATGSDDGTIKIWRVCPRTRNLIQVGHFHAHSAVTSLKALTVSKAKREEEKSNVLLVAGDKLGHVMLLEWTE